MMDKALEIYRQRYETFRHLDKLRWQMVQILVTVASVTVLLFRYTNGSMEWWLYTLLGIAVCGTGVSMNSINQGIRANSVILSRAARTVGDYGIPDVSNQRKSIAHWIALSIIVSGILLSIGSFWAAI